MSDTIVYLLVGGGITVVLIVLAVALLGDRLKHLGLQISVKDGVKAEIETHPPSSSVLLQDMYRLTHEATYYPEKSKEKGKSYYWIRIWLTADDSESLDGVAKVVYYLHPTFQEPRREISSRSDNFELKTYGYGEFTLKAEVFLKGRSEPIALSRYIHF